MADRTVVARLVLDTAGYVPAAAEASKSTSVLASAQKEAEASAKAAGIAARDAGFAARDAAAQASAAASAQSAAYKEASAAAKEASATQVTAAKATTDAERLEAEAAAQAAAERSALAKEALSQATAEAEATAQQAAAAKAGALESAKYAAAQRDIATAAKEAAGAEATAAKESAAATAERTKSYKDAGSAMNTMALGGAAAIGLMVKSAGDFQSSTQHLVTDAGESQDKLAMVQAGILKTAAATGTGATQLVDAMYHIESAGFHGQAGLDMLTTAAEGAKVGAADLGTVAKTLTGTMNSYSDAGYTNVQMMNMLIATTAAGDMKMNDLAGSLGNVTPQAASAKISYAEVGGAIATMTSQNMSADRATQDLANTIGNLQKPNQVAITQMQQLGLDSNDVSENLGSRGLTGTLELLTTAVANHTQNGQVFIDTLKSSQNAAADANTMLTQLPPSIQNISKQLLNGSITAAEYKKGISGLDAPQQHMAAQFEQLVKGSGSFNSLLAKGGPAAETFNAAMSNLLGGATGLNTALMLTGGRMATFKDNAATIQDAANKSGTEVDNWGKIQQTFNQKVDVAKASLGAMGIAIGTTLLPAVSDLAKWITGIVTPITEWVDKNKGLTEGLLGAGAALAALVLAIKLLHTTQDLLTKAFQGIDTAVSHFGKSSQDAAVETSALGAASSASAKEIDAAAVASTNAAVKADAMGAANATAARETDEAAVSANGWTGKLGASIPILGAVVLGAKALGGELNKLIDGGDKTSTSVDQWTTSLMDGSVGANTFGVSADQAQKTMESFGAKANSSIEPVAAIGVTLAKAGQMMDKGSSVVKNYDGALAALVSGGHADRAAALMSEIASATDKQGHALINTQKDFPQYWAAVDKAKASQSLAKDATTGATTALGANTDALGANATAATGAASATGTSTAETEKAEQAAKNAAAATYAQAAGQRALAEAHVADADTTKQDTVAVVAHGKAHASTTGATNAASAAAKAHTTAAKADARAQKDSAKAAADHGKANDAATKSSTAAANAEKINADTNATAAEKKKANSSATHDAAAASRSQATADNASARALDAATTASEKKAAATDKSAKAAQKAADAASAQDKAQAQADADAAKAQAEAAEADREAALVHQVGTKWLLAVADAESQASGSARDLDASVTAEVGAMKDAKDKASSLKDAMDALNGVHIAASKAAIDVQQKIADLTKALHDNGSQLDITTEKGRANMTAINDLASAANAHAQAVAEESGSIDAGNKALDASRQEFDAVLKSAGFSTSQIDQFNKTLLNTPKLAPVTVTANTAEFEAKMKALADRFGYISVQVGGGSGGRAAFAAGGLVTGVGTTTSDSNMIAVSNKEYIVNAAAVARPGMLDHLNAINFGTGNATVVKPQIPLHSLPTPAASPSSGTGAALHIENYFENGAPPQQVAAELGWLAKSRGSAW